MTGNFLKWEATNIGKYTYGLATDNINIYAALQSGAVVKINPLSMTTIDTYYEPVSEHSYVGLVCDGPHLYVASYYSGGGEVVKINASTMKFVSAYKTKLYQGISRLAYHDGFIYVACGDINYTHQGVLKIKTSDMSLVTKSEFPLADSHHQLVYAEGYIYTVLIKVDDPPLTNTEYLYKFNALDMSTVISKAVLTNVPLYDMLRAITISDYIYIALSTSFIYKPAHKFKIYKFTKSDLSQQGVWESLSLSACENMAAKRKYLYAPGIEDLGKESHGVICKIDSTNMTLVGTVIAGGSSGGDQMIWEDNLYSGLETNPGKIAKIPLSSFDNPVPDPIPPVNSLNEKLSKLKAQAQDLVTSIDNVIANVK